MAISYDRDALDAKIAKLEPSLPFRTDFAVLRDAGVAQVMGEYNTELIAADADWVRDSNFAAPLATGTETVNTTIYDIFEIALPGTQIRVAGDSIFLQQGTGVFVKVPRITLEDMIIAGGSAEDYGFYENKQKIILMIKQGVFTAPGNLCYNWYRFLLNVLVLGSTVMDIKFEDFETIAERISEYMIQNT